MAICKVYMGCFASLDCTVCPLGKSICISFGISKDNERYPKFLHTLIPTTSSGSELQQLTEPKFENLIARSTPQDKIGFVAYDIRPSVARDIVSAQRKKFPHLNVRSAESQ